MIQTGQKTAGAVLPDNPPYLFGGATRFAPARRKTISVKVGNRWIGSDHPVLVQSMTTTNTKDIDATVLQTLELWNAGCELIRITAPTAKDAECLKDIVAKVRAAGCDAPISADIHFQPRAAHEAVKWVE
jgi:(E)-4-hydroxy-3-methylbut-2-enyl-diphosphate synthase